VRRLRTGQPKGDAKRDALVRFGRNLAETSGTISAKEVSAIRAAGYTDQQLVDISLAIAVTVVTTVCNHINDTASDFPAVASTAPRWWAWSGKEGNNELAHTHFDQVWSSHRGPGLPRGARLDGPHLSVVRVSEVV
jgi:hypothetical protein